MERLEFIGDAVLKWACSAHLVVALQGCGEGQLHQAKVGCLAAGGSRGAWSYLCADADVLYDAI